MINGRKEYCSVKTRAFNRTSILKIRLKKCYWLDDLNHV